MPERFKHRSEGSDHVLTVTGELDIYAAPLFTSELAKSRDNERLIIDLSQCRYIDNRTRKEKHEPRSETTRLQ